MLDMSDTNKTYPVLGEKPKYGNSGNNEPNVEFDYEIERRVDYRDRDYIESPTIEVRRRIEILKKMLKPELKNKYWDKLIETGKDSCGCFIEMMKQYGSNENFRFHDLQTGRENGWDWVFKKLCVNDKHRIEMLSNNVDLQGLVKDLNELRNYKGDINIVFNIGGDSLMLNHNLYSMRWLTWLNLSGSHLNNRNLQSLVQVINRGGLSHLKGIVITDNENVEKKKLVQDLKKLTRGELQYLEASFKEEEDVEVNDEILQEIEVSFDFKVMNDAKKLIYLQQRGIIKGMPEIESDSLKNNVIIDYGVCSKYDWGERVRLGLANSYRGRGYRVKVDVEAALRAEKKVSERVGRTVRLPEGAPVVKSTMKRKKEKEREKDMGLYKKVRKY